MPKKKINKIDENKMGGGASKKSENQILIDRQHDILRNIDELVKEYKANESKTDELAGFKIGGFIFACYSPVSDVACIEFHGTEIVVKGLFEVMKNRLERKSGLGFLDL